MGLEDKNLRDYLIQEFGDKKIWRIYTIYDSHEDDLGELWNYKQCSVLCDNKEYNRQIMFDFSELERLCQKE
jgi:hypothetical protein